MARLSQLIGLLVVLSVVLTPIQATLGVDMTADTCSNAEYSDFECLVDQGFDFAVIQASSNAGSNTAKCISWAHLAGMKWVDVYMSICATRERDVAGAVRRVIYNMEAAAKTGTSFANLWFDVDGCATKMGSTSGACSYIDTAVSAAIDLSVSIGFYSSLEGWSKMMEQDQCASFAKYPLWYANWDDVPNFSDGANNGKWKTTMKQYYNSGPCMNVDVNYYPGTRPVSPDHRMEGSSGSGSGSGPNSASVSDSNASGSLGSISATSDDSSTSINADDSTNADDDSTDSDETETTSGGSSVVDTAADSEATSSSSSSTTSGNLDHFSDDDGHNDDSTHHSSDEDISTTDESSTADEDGDDDGDEDGDGDGGDNDAGDAGDDDAAIDSAGAAAVDAAGDAAVDAGGDSILDALGDIALAALVHGRFEDNQFYEPRRRTHEQRIFKDMTVYERKKSEHTGNGWR